MELGAEVNYRICAVVDAREQVQLPVGISEASSVASEGPNWSWNGPASPLGRWPALTDVRRLYLSLRPRARNT